MIERKIEVVANIETRTRKYNKHLCDIIFLITTKLKRKMFFIRVALL